MYTFIQAEPQVEDLVFFRMEKNSNENFINYKIDPNILSLEDKELFRKKYKLERSISNYKDFIFLTLPILKVS